MVRIKNIYIENYCGYRKSSFDFMNKDGSIKNLAVFYGPNGSGKSTILKAINLCCNAFRYEGKPTDLLFRKLTYNQDYDIDKINVEMELIKNDENISEDFKKRVLESSYTMYTRASFVDDDNYNFNNYSPDKDIEHYSYKDYDIKEVRLATDTNYGVQLNDLKPKLEGYCYYLDADNPMNMNKFQLIITDNDYIDLFLKMGKIIYGYDCHLEKIVKEGRFQFYTDLVIDKYSDRIHFKCMSDGEKKIAKLLESLCDSVLMSNMRIICIDNAVMHQYFKRHAKFLDSIVESFPKQQFLLTTHSGTLIEYAREKYGEDCLYDLEKYKLAEMNSLEKNLIS